MDELTGQESETGQLSGDDSPNEVRSDCYEEESLAEEGVETDVFTIDEVDSDHDLNIYRV